LIRFAVVACFVTLSASGALAARLSSELHSAAGQSTHPAYTPIAQPFPPLKARATGPQPPRKIRRKKKIPRRSDVFYRWSAEQLMLGGVNPSRIGNGTDDETGKRKPRARPLPDSDRAKQMP
jgi:hypothetical protein